MKPSGRALGTLTVALLLGFLAAWWLRPLGVVVREEAGTPSEAGVNATGVPESGAAPEFAPSVGWSKEAKLPAARSGEVLLTAKDEATYRQILARARSLGLDIKGTQDRLRSIRLGITDKTAWERLRGELGDRARSEPNTLVIPPPIPEAPLEAGLTAGEDRYYELLGIDAIDPSWGAGVTVAVIDSGVAEHRTFGVGVLLGPDGPSQWEEGGTANGHGTAVASLVAGGDPQAPGLAPAARVQSYSILDGSGVGDSFGLASALIEAADAGAQVINLSLGGHGDSPLVREALAYAEAKGALVVAAVGNDGTEGIAFPASLPSVLAVGSVDAEGRYASFSNRGEALDVVAPGVGLNAAWPGDRLIRMSGTSASAPVVTGMVAALLSLDARLTPVQAGALVTQYANDTGTPGPDGVYGSGVANLGRILERGSPGIHDLAVTGISAAADGSGVRVTVGVQNRGTERMFNNQLKLTVNGRVYYHVFIRLEAGESARHEWVHRGMSSNVLRLSAEIEADGRDARPEDNRVEWERSWPPGG